MLGTLERPDVGKKASKGKAIANDDRVTLLNLKGSEEEKDALNSASKETGVPLSLIARRGMAMWFKSRGLTPPANWVGK